MTKGDAEDLGLSSVMGAIVSDVTEGPAKAAGIRVDDLIVEFNGKPVKNSDELVAMVVRTAPGTTVPVKVIRGKKPMTLNVTVAELDVQAEQQQVQAAPEANEPKETGFGMSIEGITPNLARRLGLPSGRGGAVVSEVDPTSPAAEAGIRPGDVITMVNGQTVTSVDQVADALDAIAAGRTARIVVFRGGREVLVQVRKR
jgi:serine protease Do